MDEFAVIYLDNILIFTDTRRSHVQHLCLISSRLHKNEQYAGRMKCEITHEQPEILGL